MLANRSADTIKSLLSRAWQNPSAGGVYYSANGAAPASDRLKAIPHWDWTPEPSLSAEGGSTCMFALAMGCEPTWTSDGKLWVKKLISDPQQVKDLPIPDPRAGLPGEILTNAARLAAELPPGARLRCPDVQSPLGVAELMWDESFYICLIEAPEAVHDLLDKITRYIIAFVSEFQRIAGPRLNPCGFPGVWAEGSGTMVADDTMSLVSPAMHAEFSVPYLNRLSDACGPLYYHSCTWRKEYFDNLHNLRNVRSWNWNPGDSIDFGIIAREFAGTAMIAPHLAADMHREKGVLSWGRHFADEYEFFRYCVESAPASATLYWWFSNVLDKAMIMENIYDYLHRRGYTPQAQGLA